MSDREYYINRISEMIASIGNLDWLIKIYSFIKVFTDDKESGIIDE